MPYFFLPQGREDSVVLKTLLMLFSAGWARAISQGQWSQQWLQALMLEWKLSAKVDPAHNPILGQRFIGFSQILRDKRKTRWMAIYTPWKLCWEVLGDKNKALIFLLNLSPTLPSKKWLWPKETDGMYTESSSKPPSGKRGILDPETLSKLTNAWPRHLRVIVLPVASGSHLPTVITRCVVSLAGLQQGM